MNWKKRLADGLKGLPWCYWILSLLALTIIPAAILLLVMMGDGSPLLSVFLSYPAISFFIGCWGTVHFTKKPLSWLAAYAPNVGLLLGVSGVVLLIFSGGFSYQSPDALFILSIFLTLLLLGLLGFFIGERIAARRHSVTRKRPSRRQLGVMGLCVLVFVGTCGVLRYQRSMDTIVLSDDEGWKLMVPQRYATGYGWPYEEGWSSVDLSPYYVENSENRLAVLDAPSSLVITEESEMPVLDGAEAAYPVYSAFANACYEGIAGIQRSAKEHNIAERPIRFTNTVEAYKSLIAGDVDIFFGARPSEAQLALAEEAGAELELTPIGKEAFVFFVSEDNPVDGLTSEQIRSIYSGRTNNWLFLGGGFQTIMAFQRPENSGSQTMMQYFMGDVPLREPLAEEYNASMIGVLREVAEYRNNAASIGYSFRYYASQMVFEESAGDIKFLALDGVYPDRESIRSGSYPMTTALYAITVKGNENPNVQAFTDWMMSEQGQVLVERTGYVTAQ